MIHNVAGPPPVETYDLMMICVNECAISYLWIQLIPLTNSPLDWKRE